MYLTFLFVNVRINMDSGRSGDALEDGRAIGDVEHYTYYKKQEIHVYLLRATTNRDDEEAS